MGNRQWADRNQILILVLCTIAIVGAVVGWLVSIPESASPIPTPDSPIKSFQVIGTPTLTPTATPIHWTSNSIEILCQDDNPELYIPEDTEPPLISINLNLQLRDEQGIELLQGAIFNIIQPGLGSCDGTGLEIHYDWREHEDNLEIPSVAVEEFGFVSFTQLTTPTIYLDPDGLTPWNPDDQDFLFNHNGTVEANEDYVFLRSYEWASPTPTATPTPSPTNTPTPTPTPKLVRVFLPIILK